MLERISDHIAQTAIEGSSTRPPPTDFKTMEVLAKVGSSDFANLEIRSGRRNSPTRSPGSTLKPFVYALALDQGKIHPSCEGCTHTFGDYNPENFDREFRPIRTDIARAQSRHARLGIVAVHEFLRSRRRCRNASFYGLSTTGGRSNDAGSARLTALANGGKLHHAPSLE